MTDLTHDPTEPSARLIFVRHGRADGVEGRCVGHCDLPLSTEGAAEIQDMTLSTSGNVRVVSSDLKRALQSAEIIAQKFGVSVSTDVRLREMDFGEWEGQLWSDLVHTDATRLARWMEHWTEAAPPSGESVSELASRVQSWLHDVLSMSLNTCTTTIVVAHAGSIRAALCTLRNIPLALMFDLAVEHAIPIIEELGAAPQAPRQALPDQSV